MSFTTLLYYINYGKSFYVYTLSSVVFRRIFWQRLTSIFRRLFSSSNRHWKLFRSLHSRCNFIPILDKVKKKTKLAKNRQILETFLGNIRMRQKPNATFVIFPPFDGVVSIDRFERRALKFFFGFDVVPPLQKLINSKLNSIKKSCSIGEIDIGRIRCWNLFLLNDRWVKTESAKRICLYRFDQCVVDRFGRFRHRTN